MREAVLRCVPKESMLVIIIYILSSDMPYDFVFVVHRVQKSNSQTCSLKYQVSVSTAL